MFNTFSNQSQSFAREFFPDLLEISDFCEKFMGNSLFLGPPVMLSDIFALKHSMILKILISITIG